MASPKHSPGEAAAAAGGSGARPVLTRAVSDLTMTGGVPVVTRVIAQLTACETEVALTAALDRLLAARAGERPGTAGLCVSTFPEVSVYMITVLFASSSSTSLLTVLENEADVALCFRCNACRSGPTSASWPLLSKSTRYLYCLVRYLPCFVMLLWSLMRFPVNSVVSMIAGEGGPRVDSRSREEIRGLSAGDCPRSSVRTVCRHTGTMRVSPLESVSDTSLPSSYPLLLLSSTSPLLRVR